MTKKLHQIEMEKQENRLNLPISKSAVCNLKHTTVSFDAKRVAIWVKVHDEMAHIALWFDANYGCFLYDFTSLFLLNSVTCWLLGAYKLLENSGYLEQGRLSFQIRKSDKGICKIIW